jgi:hypothetical protein
LVLAAIALGGIVARPASSGLRAAAGLGDLALARWSAGRLSQVLIAESLLWSGSLIAMIV